MTQSAQLTKSCFNCKHVSVWNDPGSYWQPPDEGWECGHIDQTLVNQNFRVEHDYSYDNDEKLGQELAEDCLSYTFFDWDAHKQAMQQSVSDVPPETLKSIYLIVNREFGVID